MSSRDDHRRRDRSWERDNRGDRDRRDRYPRGGEHGRHREEGRRRTSRSRSPARGERDRRGAGRRDYRRDDDRREYRRDEDGRRDKDGFKGGDNRDRDRGAAERERDKKDGKRRDDKGRETLHGEDERSSNHDAQGISTSGQDVSTPASLSRPNLDPDAEEPGTEEGEAMDEIDDDSAAMMAMMGVGGFGSTKGKHVTGNQEGAVNVKKMRTWRQYMNRRGGFNRPLDKIK
ncbi:hypothetical protein BDQ17DRAFT_1348020 [Cyathus striatus]|nr:hypothetical protein BDQ17DRAFT_1348020 [Cyathus striatus]